MAPGSIQVPGLCEHATLLRDVAASAGHLTEPSADVSLQADLVGGVDGG